MGGPGLGLPAHSALALAESEPEPRFSVREPPRDPTGQCAVSNTGWCPPAWGVQRTRRAPLWRDRRPEAVGFWAPKTPLHRKTTADLPRVSLPSRTPAHALTRRCANTANSAAPPAARSPPLGARCPLAHATARSQTRSTAEDWHLFQLQRRLRPRNAGPR